MDNRIQNSLLYKDRVGLQLNIPMFIGCLLLIASSCTGLRKIPQDQFLVTKNELVITDKHHIVRAKKVKNELYDELTPKPNGKVLWMRPRLAFHNLISEPKKEKGFKYWLKYKLGKPPAILDEALCEKMNLTLVNRLYHNGNFNAQSSVEIEKKKKTAQITYTIKANQAYKIDTFLIPEMDNPLSRTMAELNETTVIKSGTAYNLELLKQEIDRIDNGLKNRGFYYFDPDYILFLMDTANNSHTVKLKLSLKDNTPTEAKKIYTINRISIAEDFRLENYHPDTVLQDNYSIISSSHFMRPKIYINSILFDRGDIYAREKHNNSLRQLMGLRSYKYVNARYNDSKEFNNKLDVTYMMTPSPKMSASAELNAVSKSNNFAGPGIKLSYKSRNFFRGAELFSLNLNGRFEKQISGEKQGDTAYEVSIDASLDVPRLIPFRQNKQNNPYLPNAKLMIGTGVFARVSLYKFSTYTTGLEYSWRKNEFFTHVFKPIDVSFTNLLNATDEFNLFLLRNPSIRRSFEEQFIIGSSYNFIINKLANTNRKQYYVNAGADPSGNLISLLGNLTIGDENSTDKKVTIFGVPISQYFRIHTDLRYYFKTGKESRIATRLYAGVGIPYGNSTVMPYVKQFYAGGTNSMRAFRARSLGPGSYLPPDSLQNILVDQTGEIKLELNAEYRFPIAGFLKGALFSDIGNIWLVNSDSLRPGGKFEWEYFHKELAVGIGFGLRIDVELVVLRIDWSFPVRKPWLPNGERWIFKEIDLFNSRWRKDNLLWNISIGYPF